MVTSPNDPRVVAAVNGAMKAAYQKLGVIDRRGDFVWSLVYPQWAGKAGYAWCGGFMVWAYRQVGVDLMRCAWWFYTPYIVNFARSHGFWRATSSYGAQPLFDWNRDGVADHVGAANPDPNSASYRSIEGNTSSGVVGSQSNGGGVWQRYRNRGDILGWIDMHATLAWMIDTGKWDGKTGGIPAPLETVTSKTKTKTDGQDALDVDGSQGPATIARWQQVMGTPIDGTISTPSECIKAFQRFLNTAVTEEWISKLTGKKQLDIDGQAGSKTWRVFQFWVANTWPAQMKLICGFTRDSDNKRFWSEWVDGNPGPWTTKMLQYALNKSYKDSGKLGAKK